jgi:fructan beta-fructosidase
MKKAILFFAYIFILSVCFAQNNNAYKEQYRPQIHFSPKAHWMNDPNGMVYNNGVYHLFFQYYPDSTIWGPMHWGHATSTDMIHWQEKPIALYPDSIGYIFSGSAVMDKNNTSGFGKDGKAPMVAIFTQHDPVGEKEKNNIYQNQSIAYSLDNGKTFIKYNHNPVLKNPGITDFRDPKVTWYEPQHTWIMTLATKDHITFYSSPDLKDWKKESEFGKEVGAHGGVWECPDLFSFDDNGKIIWVLVVNLNPGGPNGGSATQYFVGDFDGKSFTPINTITKWLDYGPDEYAGVTWSNTGNRKIFLGWMSNWLYANIVPTSVWRNAMTIPRELKLKHVGNDIFVSSEPVKELEKIESTPVILKNVQVSKSFDLSAKTKAEFPCRVDLNFEGAGDFTLAISNDAGEKLLIGYDKKQNEYFIDRTKSGNAAFYKDFAAKHVAPRLTNNQKINLSLVMDESSVELFADDGLTVMTEIFFPSKPYDHINIQSAENISIQSLSYSKLNSIW